MVDLQTTRQADVVIVGAGPAGVMAALALVPKGLTVLILEAAAGPANKVCGGAVTERALALIPSGIAIPWERSALGAELHVHELGRHWVADQGSALAHTVVRDAFDRALRDAATAAGALLWSSCRALAVRHRGAHLEIATSRGDLRTQFLIVADGVNGTTARHAGWTTPLVRIPALVLEVETDAATVERFGQRLRFDLGVTPHGFGWVSPKRRHLSVGLVRTRRGPGDLKTMLRRYLELLGVAVHGNPTPRGRLLPVLPHDGPLVRGRILLAGDAAGLSDPLLGEGLFAALLSGRLAGQAILAGELDPWRVEYHYGSRLEEQILADLPYARLAAWVLHRLPATRRWLFARHGQRLTDAVADVAAGKRRYRDLFWSLKSYRALLQRGEPS